MTSLDTATNTSTGGASWPTDPIAAATHPDPYPYYAQLAAERPLYRDEGLGMWVASSAAAVTAVLASEICRVRPPTEPVPRTIADSPAGEIFRHLVRQNDGAKHCPFNKAIGTTLNDVSLARLANHTRERARALAMELTPQCDRAGLTRFIFALPVQVMASLLGVPDARLADVADWVNSFVIAFSPIANPTDIEQGKKAASQLLDLFRALLDAQQPDGAPETLLGVLAQHARRLGCSENDIIIANGIGFMSQSYEATAGLIGNTLLALATHDEVHAAVRRSPDLIGDLIQEVLHWDPPTQSTRRFVACGGMIAGAPMCEGDAILVILAAASRDPAVVGAARFDLFRKDRRIFNFGSGVHACPADRTAPLIAQIAIRHLLDADVELEHLGTSRSYRCSPAVRAPIFSASA